MTAHFLARVQKTNVVLGLIAMATSGVIWGAMGLLAAGVGAALACANLAAIRRLAITATERAAHGDGVPAAGALLSGLGIKMILLFGLVGLAIWGLHLSVMPFALGISVLVASLVLAGFWTSFSEAF